MKSLLEAICGICFVKSAFKRSRGTPAFPFLGLPVAEVHLRFTSFVADGGKLINLHHRQNNSEKNLGPLIFLKVIPDVGKLKLITITINGLPDQKDPRANRNADGFDGSIQLKFCTNY